MALFDKISDDLKEAMKSKDQGALRAIRSVKSALLLMKTESADKEISENDEIKLLQKLVKQRKESIELFLNKGRNDLATGEQEELAVLEKYLPKQLTLEEIRIQILELINQLSINSVSEIGKLMQAATKHFAGKADGKTISTIAKEILSGK